MQPETLQLGGVVLNRTAKGQWTLVHPVYSLYVEDISVFAPRLTGYNVTLSYRNIGSIIRVQAKTLEEVYADLVRLLAPLADLHTALEKT